MQAIRVAALPVQTHSGVVAAGGQQDGEAVGAEYAFNGILPFRVGNAEHGAEENNFAAGKSQLGAQQAAQAAGLWCFAFVTDFAVAGAQFADFIFQPGGFDT